MRRKGDDPDIGAGPDQFDGLLLPVALLGLTAAVSRAAATAWGEDATGIRPQWSRKATTRLGGGGWATARARPRQRPPSRNVARSRRAGDGLDDGGRQELRQPGRFLGDQVVSDPRSPPPPPSAGRGSACPSAVTISRSRARVAATNRSDRSRSSWSALATGSPSRPGTGAA